MSIFQKNIIQSNEHISKKYYYLSQNQSNLVKLGCCLPCSQWCGSRRELLYGTGELEGREWTS